jgi:hypothetical protein
MNELADHSFKGYDHSFKGDMKVKNMYEPLLF